MTRKLIPFWTSLCAMLLLMPAGPVHAQATLWVSALGNDGNVCSQAAPCLTFQGAVNKGAGQINCLTSGDYGPVTITASITIDCGTGNVGNIKLSNGVGNGNAITISTSGAATIVLRHLSLNGLHIVNGSFGINASTFPSGTLVVEDCTIQGFSGGFGIAFQPTAGRGLLQVSNTQILDNQVGIGVQASSGQIASVTLSQVAMVANLSWGLALAGPGVVAGTMRDSLAGENAYGVYTDTAVQAFFTIEESSVIANTTAGIFTQSAGAAFNVGSSTLGANGIGVNPSAGSIISFGNNQFSANATDGNFTGTKTLK
jgi:hypothetical protein